MRPSGDHLKLLIVPSWNCVSGVASPPVDAMRKICGRCLSRAEMNAIFCPSGDQRPWESRLPDVNCRGSVAKFDWDSSAQTSHKFVSYSFFSPACFSTNRIIVPSGDTCGSESVRSRRRSSGVIGRRAGGRRAFAAALEDVFFINSAVCWTGITLRTSEYREAYATSMWLSVV